MLCLSVGRGSFVACCGEYSIMGGRGDRGVCDGVMCGNKACYKVIC